MSNSITIPASTVERIPVVVTIDGADRATVQGYTVEATVTTGAEPSSGWKAGSWDAAADVLTALAPIGGSGIAVSAGEVYRLWLRITGGGETVVIDAGGLRTLPAASYTGDPAGVPADLVRFLVGDTEAPLELSDAEVVTLIAVHGAGYPAAAAAAEVLAARYARRSEEESQGDVSQKWGDRSARLADVAARLRARASAGAGDGTGGVDTASIAAVLAVDAAPPMFATRMFDSPRAAWADWRLR